MFKNLRKFARGTLTLSSVLSVNKFQEYVRKGNIGFEIVDDKYFAKKNILVIAPHFDDESFGLGGTISRFASAESDITILYLTDGERGTKTGQIDKKLTLRRKAEAEKAIATLGKNIAKIYFDLPDGSLSPSVKNINKVSSLVSTLKPTHIFIPCAIEANDDHANAFKVASLALKSRLKTLPRLEVWQYEVWTPLIPNRIIPIGSVTEKKKKAILCHKSQLESRDISEGIIGLNQYRGAITANLSQPAEAFFALPLEQFLSFYKNIHLKSQ